MQIDLFKFGLKVLDCFYFDQKKLIKGNRLRGCEMSGGLFGLFFFTASVIAHANNALPLMNLTMQQWINTAADPNAKIVGSSISGAASAFAASLTHKACILNAVKNKNVDWKSIAANSLLLQKRFIDLIEKDTRDFNQYLTEKNAQKHRDMQNQLLDNSIKLIDYNTELLGLIENTLPHASLFLKGDFITACELAKTGAYSAIAFLDSNLKAFKDVADRAKYEKALGSRVRIANQFKRCL